MQCPEAKETREIKQEKKIKDNKKTLNLGGNYRERPSKWEGENPFGASPPKSPGDQTPPPY